MTFLRLLLGSALAAVTTAASAAAPTLPSMEEIVIRSDGARMNGLVYLAAGSEPRPVVVFLHGFPGNERNLDLAQAVRRAGYQAIYFDYRGSWGSAGDFSFAHGLDDVAAALAWVRDPANAAKYRFDTRRIAVVGHSYGGWLALMAGARQDTHVCVAGLAAWNVGWSAQRFAAHEDERSSTLEDFRGSTDPDGGPLHASADALLAEMTTHAEAWNYLSQAGGLKDRALLLVGATHDTPDEDVAQLAGLAHAVREAGGGRRLRSLSVDDDHPFSAHRIELGRALTQWLGGDCAQAQARP
jgi:pimeloyl-ACP methyl ester carboxylesterase